MIDPYANTPMHKVDEEVSRFEAGRISPLHFAPELERRFHMETSGARSRTLMLQGMIALFAYDSFIVGDYFMNPQHIGLAIVIRFCVVTPIVLLVALLMRKERNHLLQESAATLLCLLGAVSILYLHYRVGPLLESGAQVGLILVLLVANCMLRLDLAFAAWTSALVVGLNILSLRMDYQLDTSEKMVSGGMLFWVAVLALIANFSLSRERRFSYLLQLRGRLQRGLLADANAELQAISLTDRLTGLPNRRAYDHALVDLWELSLERRDPISAVMVDVDSFKQLNDNHGHPYGDRVLQRIASLLQQALRAEDDFVARFGGEEFIVLLPSATPEVALKVAERIRTLVQVAGSPALTRDSVLPVHEIWATVSCGVATAWPSLGQDSARLIADADAAMYRAKQEGRNRVCCAAPAALTSKVTVFPSALGRS
jgi:diguanylate cyclase (GGDEF)-like protein